MAYDKIIETITDSADYRISGIGTNVHDGFIFQKDKKLYFVTIIEKYDYLPNHKPNSTYSYAIYSLSSKKYIRQSLVEYKKLVETFPTINSVVCHSTNKAKQLLNEELKAIVDGIRLTFSKKNKQRYADYLKERSLAAKPEMKDIYNFFIENANKVILQ